jgi:hypothetical protein
MLRYGGRLRLRHIDDQPLQVAGAHRRLRDRSAFAAFLRVMVDDPVRLFGLRQRVPFVPRLAPRFLARLFPQATRAGRFLQAIARRRLVAVGTVQTKPSLKFRHTGRQRCDLLLLSRNDHPLLLDDQQKGLDRLKLQWLIRALHKELESRRFCSPQREMTSANEKSGPRDIHDSRPLPSCPGELPSFSKLWAVQTTPHSARTFSMPRSRNWRKPRACLICPNTGSGNCLRSR